MRRNLLWQTCFLSCLVPLLLNGCATKTPSASSDGRVHYSNADPDRYVKRMAPTIETNEKVIVVDPKSYAWGAYSADGKLVRAGIATAGGDYCPDEGGPCRTSTGTFRLNSLGNVNCRSSIYPIPKGGSLMPYCMFFKGGQSLHGSPDGILVEANLSHGCVHLRIPDAEWIRFNFAQVGTKVVILPYATSLDSTPPPENS